MPRKVYLEHVKAEDKLPENQKIWAVDFWKDDTHTATSRYVAEDEIPVIQAVKSQELTDDGFVFPDAGYNTIAKAVLNVHKEATPRTADDITFADGYVDVPEGGYATVTRKDFDPATDDTEFSYDGTDVKLAGEIKDGTVADYATDTDVDDIIPRRGCFPSSYTTRDTVTIAPDYKGWVLVEFESLVPKFDSEFSPIELCAYVSDGQIVTGWLRGWDGCRAALRYDFEFGKSGDTQKPCPATIDDGVFHHNVDLPEDTTIKISKCTMNIDGLDWSVQPIEDPETPYEKHFELDAYVVHELIPYKGAFKFPEEGVQVSYNYSDEIKAIGEHNRDVLTTLATQHDKLILEKDEYPIATGVVMDNCELDMNGSLLYKTDYYANAALLKFTGNNTSIRNGTIAGSNDKDKDQSPPSVPSSSYAVSFAYGTFEEAELSNIVFTNLDNKVFFMGNEQLVAARQYQADKQNPSERIVREDGCVGRKYMFQISKISSGTSRNLWLNGKGFRLHDIQISDEPADVEFKDTAGETLAIHKVIPGDCVEKPTGTEYIYITTWAKQGQEYPFENTAEKVPYPYILDVPSKRLIVYDVTAQFCRSNGIIEPKCNMYMYNCTSSYYGRPRPDSGLDSRANQAFVVSATGYVPTILIENCSFAYDKAQARGFSGSCWKFVVLRSSGKYEIANARYGYGQYLNNGTIYQGYTGGASAPVVNGNADIFFYDSRPYGFGSQEFYPTARTWSRNISTTYADGSEPLQYRPGMMELVGVHGEVKKTTVPADKWNYGGYAPGGTADIWVIGTHITGAICNAPVNGRTGEPSWYKIYCYASEKGGADYINKNISALIGDIYNFETNELFYMNGFTAHDCTYNYDSQARTGGEGGSSGDFTKYNGTFDGCTFNYSNTWYSNSAKTTGTNTTSVTFKDCAFNDGRPDGDAKQAIGDVFLDGSDFTFTNCTYNGTPMTDMSADDVKLAMFTKTNNRRDTYVITVN